MHCENCGALLPENADVCIKCGALANKIQYRKIEKKYDEQFAANNSAYLRIARFVLYITFFILPVSVALVYFEHSTYPFYQNRIAIFSAAVSFIAIAFSAFAIYFCTKARKEAKISFLLAFSIIELIFCSIFFALTIYSIV